MVDSLSIACALHSTILCRNAPCENLRCKWCVVCFHICVSLLEGRPWEPQWCFVKDVSILTRKGLQEGTTNDPHLKVAQKTYPTLDLSIINLTIDLVPPTIPPINLGFLGSARFARSWCRSQRRKLLNKKPRHGTGTGKGSATRCR